MFRNLDSNSGFHESNSKFFSGRSRNEVNRLKKRNKLLLRLGGTHEQNSSILGNMHDACALCRTCRGAKRENDINNNYAGH